MPDVEPLVELPLFKTLLALLMNLEKPWGFSPGGSDPPGAEELIFVEIPAYSVNFGRFQK